MLDVGGKSYEGIIDGNGLATYSPIIPYIDKHVKI